MKPAVPFAMLPAGVAFCPACNRTPRIQPGLEARKPVVTVAPVPTRPFEEGYRVGFDFALQQAKPKAKLPDVGAVRGQAREQAARHPERNERWERGFVDGYNDGFRNVVTGQK